MNFTFGWHYSRPGEPGIAGAVLAENLSQAMKRVCDYLHIVIPENSNETLRVWTSREEWNWANADPNCHIIVY